MVLGNAVKNDGKVYAKDTIRIRTVTIYELIAIVSHCRKSSIPTGIFKTMIQQNKHRTSRESKNE